MQPICIFADSLQMSHTCHRFWKCYKTLTFCSLWTRCETTSKPPKVARTCGLLYILTSKCALRHNCTFSSQLPKSCPSMVCFVHFDFEMCFAPQRRDFFDISTSNSGPSMGVFCTFWLRNVLRAIGRHFFDILTSKILPFCASASSFFGIFLFSDLLSSNLSLCLCPALLFICPLSEVWLLNFLH